MADSKSRIIWNYCHAMDQDYASIPANLANRSILEARERYQREGVR